MYVKLEDQIPVGYIRKIKGLKIIIKIKRGLIHEMDGPKRNVGGIKRIQVHGKRLNPY